MSDSFKSSDDQFHQWSDLEVIPLEHPEDALELFDSETDGIGSTSRPAFSVWSVALLALVAVVTGAFIGASIANRKVTVRSDTSPRPPVVALTALPSVPHVVVTSWLPFRSTTYAVERQPDVAVDARRDASAPVAVLKQRVVMRPVHRAVAVTTAVADAVRLPIDAGPTVAADEDTSPHPVTRLGPVAAGVNPVPSARFELSVAASALDPDGDALTYKWSAPTGSFANPDASRTTFTCPGAPVEVPLTVTVTDSNGGSATDTVIVRCVAATRESSR